MIFSSNSSLISHGNIIILPSKYKTLDCPKWTCYLIINIESNGIWFVKQFLVMLRKTVEIDGCRLTLLTY